ncbi:MAG: hypothetical protein K5662_09070 [Lachnospiraceae bacterium]|nr:hypothetical protein [Lachnospiraceae bacterium]
MRNYKELLEYRADMPEVRIIQQDIETSTNWGDAYCIGQYVYEQASGEADKLIMDAYEKAFGLGLNIRVNREFFLAATQQIARIYFRFQKYDEAINKLMVLDSNVDDLPDWVNLYYASAYIHTENILYWAEVPNMLFKRIDDIDENNPESVKRRKYLFLEFLNRISELSETKDVSAVDKDAILAKAVELGLIDSRECLNFKVALGIISTIPELSEPESRSEAGEKASSVYEHMAVELNKRLSELQTIIDKQTITIAKDKKLLADQKKLIVSLQEEKKNLENNANRLIGELKNAKELEYAIQAKCKTLESQLSGSESARKQMEDNTTVIGELKADVEDLKTALTVSRRTNDKLQIEIAQHQEIISGLKDEVLQSKEEVQGLNAIIESQKIQIEIAEAAVKAVEEKVATTELLQDNNDTPKRSSVTSVAPTLLDILTVDNFLSRRKKILIIGGSETKENHLRGKLKSMGFNFTKDQLEFELEYDNVKDYASRIRPWSGKYAGIIVGPCPHKAKDIDGYSSFIEQIKSEEGYPHVEEARDKCGTLKISNESIGDAMMKMAVYLQSIA